MSTTIHVGKQRLETVATSDGSVIPPGALTAISSNPNMVTAAVDPTTNNVTLTGVATGPSGVTITYAAPGYQGFDQVVFVAALPWIVVTDGPET